MAVLTAGLLVALLIGLARGRAFGIPFMAIGAIALTYRRRRIGRLVDEKPGGNRLP